MLSGDPLSLDSIPASALRVLTGDEERGDWPEPCRPRRERVDGLTVRDEGASSPDETTCEGAARAREGGGGERGQPGLRGVKGRGWQVLWLNCSYYE